MPFFNLVPLLDIPGGPPFEGSYGFVGGFPQVAQRAVMPVPWTFLGACLRIGSNTNAPGEAFTVSLAIGGVPSVASVAVVGPTFGFFPLAGFPLAGPAGSMLSWFLANAGTGVVGQITICALFKRTGQAAPTRGLISWQNAGGGSGPGANFRGMYQNGMGVPFNDYVRLALPFAGVCDRLVGSVRSNGLDVPVLYGLEHNGVFALPTAFAIPVGFTGPVFSPPPPPPAPGFPLPVAIGDSVTFGYDGSSAMVGGIVGSLGAQFSFPI